MDCSWAIAADFTEAATPVHDLVKAKYGVDLKVNANGTLDYVAKVSKALGEIQAGAPASYDLLDASDTSMYPLLPDGALKVDWARYIPNMPPAAVVEKSMLVVANKFRMPAYNTKLIPAAEAPKTYDDLLDPKWKGQVSTFNASIWTWLAQPDLWGEARLKDYMRKFAAQKPVLDADAGMLSRLLSGEYPVSSGMDFSRIAISVRKGDPVAFIAAPPTRNGAYGEVIPKNAVHPNAATLVSLALITPDGQAIKEKVTAVSAAWLPGTSAAKFTAEHPTVLPDIKFLAENGDRLNKEIEQILRSGS